jgi:hypothetical protein
MILYSTPTSGRRRAGGWPSAWPASRGWRALVAGVRRAQRGDPSRPTWRQRPFGCERWVGARPDVPALSEAVAAALTEVFHRPAARAHITSGRCEKPQAPSPIVGQLDGRGRLSRLQSSAWLLIGGAVTWLGRSAHRQKAIDGPLVVVPSRSTRTVSCSRTCPSGVLRTLPLVPDTFDEALRSCCLGTRFRADTAPAMAPACVDHDRAGRPRHADERLRLPRPSPGYQDTEQDGELRNASSRRSLPSATMYQGRTATT